MVTSASAARILPPPPQVSTNNNHKFLIKHLFFSMLYNPVSFQLDSTYESRINDQVAICGVSLLRVHTLISSGNYIISMIAVAACKRLWIEMKNLLSTRVLSLEFPLLLLDPFH
jgi:hypothetical protein